MLVPGFAIITEDLQLTFLMNQKKSKSFSFMRLKY